MKALNQNYLKKIFITHFKTHTHTFVLITLKLSLKQNNSPKQKQQTVCMYVFLDCCSVCIKNFTKYILLLLLCLYYISEGEN